jgi:hypothetical protein
MIDTTSIQNLRTFAELHGELQFVHLCTTALAGEEWAVERVSVVVAEVARTQRRYRNEVALNFIRATDTIRPDGAIARGGIEV